MNIFRRFACAALLLWTVAVSPNLVTAAGPAPVFRVFLKDGTALACWGEYARVNDRLVLTVPVGKGSRTAYEFVSIPVAKVDMPRTERYAEAVRAAQFAANRGAAEYKTLSERLAEQLANIASLQDPKERLASAESARQELLDWAGSSHGYRAKEVQQLLQLFDSAIIDLRVAAGESRFAINLSAAIVPPTPPRLRGALGLRESIALAARAAAVADSPEAKVSLLRRASAAAKRLPTSEENAKLRSMVDRQLRAALRVETLYRKLDADTRRLALRAVDLGDVVGIDAIRQRVVTTDRLLGKHRPDDVALLLEWVDGQREAAAEQRLVLDQWESTRELVRDYLSAAVGLAKSLDAVKPALTAIAKMSGPPLTEVVRVERQTSAMVAQYAQLVAPDSVADAHQLLALAIEQADRAVRTRHRAVALKQLPAAREAAAAATDAITRLAQAQAALAAAQRPPKAIR